MLCAGPTCRVPVDWKGHYYQSGVGAVVIRAGLVTTKGVCVEQERDYYLFSNRSNTSLHIYTRYAIRIVISIYTSDGAGLRVKCLHAVMSSDAYSTVARLTINTLLLYSLCRVVWVGLMHGLRAIDSVQVD